MVDNDLAVFSYGGEVVFTWQGPPQLSKEHVAMICESWESGLSYGQVISGEQAKRGQDAISDLQAFLDDLTGENP